MEEKVIVKSPLENGIITFIFVLCGVVAALPLIIAIAIGDDMLIMPTICIFVAYLIGLGIASSVLAKEYIITDKRIVALCGFNHRIDIPIEKITGIKSGFFNSLIVSSPSAKIILIGCKNITSVISIIESEMWKKK